MSITTVNPDIDADQAVFDFYDPDARGPIKAAATAGAILKKFDGVLKTESATYLAFCRLSQREVTFLIAYWAMKDDWEAFKRVCYIQRIKVA